MAGTAGGDTYIDTNIVFGYIKAIKLWVVIWGYEVPPGASEAELNLAKNIQKVIRAKQIYVLEHESPWGTGISFHVGACTMGPLEQSLR